MLANHKWPSGHPAHYFLLNGYRYTYKISLNVKSAGHGGHLEKNFRKKNLKKLLRIAEASSPRTPARTPTSPILPRGTLFPNLGVEPCFETPFLFEGRRRASSPPVSSVVILTHTIRIDHDIEATQRSNEQLTNTR